MIFCVPVGRASLDAEDAVLAEQVGELRVGGVWPEQGLHRVQVDDVTVAHHLEAGTKQETRTEPKNLHTSQLKNLCNSSLALRATTGNWKESTLYLLII